VERSTHGILGSAISTKLLAGDSMTETFSWLSGWKFSHLRSYLRSDLHSPCWNEIRRAVSNRSSMGLTFLRDLPFRGRGIDLAMSRRRLAVGAEKSAEESVVQHACTLHVLRVRAAVKRKLQERCYRTQAAASMEPHAHSRTSIRRENMKNPCADSHISLL
jgi:hypothetical protein